MSGRLARVAVAVALAVILAGCVAALPSYDQRGGASIADHIRSVNSPMVESVWYHRGDHLDGATIDVTMRVGATRTQARWLICTVTIPAIRAGDPPEGLSVVVLFHDHDTFLASDGDPCPEPRGP